jgi:hypothetical protein
MNAPQESIVTRWRGPSFDMLLPLLQEPHRNVGSLHDVVSIQKGRERPLGVVLCPGLSALLV